MGLGNRPISNETRSDDKASSPGGQFHIINLGHGMSDYTKLSAEALLKQRLKEIQAKIAEKQKSEADLADKYTTSVKAFMSIDKQNYNTNVMIAKQVASMVSAAVGFVPIYGPAASAAMNLVITAADPTLSTKQKAMIGAIGLLHGGMTLTATNSMTMPTDNSAPFHSPVLAPSMEEFKAAFPGAVISGTTSFIPAFTGMLTAFTTRANVSGKNAIALLPATQKSTDTVLLNHAFLIEQAFNIQPDPINRKRAKYMLAFYNQLKAMNAGGRGNLLLDTQVANLEDNLDKYKSMSDVKLALRQVANT